MLSHMPRRLKRYYGRGDLHYITGSCVHRRPLMGSAEARDFFLFVFEQVRRRYVFDVIAYVVMPEHFHLLISEPERGDPSVVMKVLKQTVSRKLLPSTGTRFWQPRFYDFNVFSEQKKNEKINYIHKNPVTRGLGFLFGAVALEQLPCLFARRKRTCKYGVAISTSGCF